MSKLPVTREDGMFLFTINYSDEDGATFHWSGGTCIRLERVL